MACAALISTPVLDDDTNPTPAAGAGVAPCDAGSAVRTAILAGMTKVLDRMQVTEFLPLVTGGDETLIAEALDNMTGVIDAVCTEATGQLIKNLLFDVSRLKATYDEARKVAFIQLHMEEIGLSLLYAQRCPITLSRVKHPVMAMDGFIYEQSAVETLIGTRERAKSPVTNMTMTPTLIESAPLRQMLGDITTLQQGLAELAWVHEEAMKGVQLGQCTKACKPAIILTDACGTVCVPHYGDMYDTSLL